MNIPEKDSCDVGLGPVEAWIYRDDFRESQFFAELLNRLVCGRDMNIIITASSETGVGKTTLAASIAIMIDQNGWTADKAAVASAAEYDMLYDTVKPGSCLILDEAEKAADARRGMANESVSLTQSFATKRYRQVFSILTAPTKTWVDKRLNSDAADYWIQANETDMGRVKGEADVYRLKTNEHYETDYSKWTELVHWPNLDGHDEFDELDRRKRALLESDDESSYVDKTDVEELKKEAVESATEKQRRQAIVELDSVDGITQSDIADVYGISQSRVSQIIND